MLATPLIDDSLKATLSGVTGGTGTNRQLKSRIESVHNSFKVRKTFLKSGIVHVCLSKDRSKLYAITKVNNLILINTEYVEIEKTLVFKKCSLCSLALSYDEKTVAIGTVDGKIHSVSAESFQLKFTINFGETPIKALAFSGETELRILEKDGSLLTIEFKYDAGRPRITTGGRNYLVQCWDGTYFAGNSSEARNHINSYRSKQIFEPRDKILNIFLTHNYLIALLENQVCEIFLLDSGNIVDDIYLSEDASYATMTRDEKILIVAGKSGLVYFYDLQFPQRYYKIQMASQSICYMFIKQETQEIIAFSGEVRCSICKIPSFKSIESIKVNTSHLMFISSDNLAYISKGSIFLYNVHNKETKFLFRVPGISPFFTFIAPNHIVTTNANHLIFFNMANNVITQFLYDKNIYSKLIVVSPQLTSLLITTVHNTLTIFDLVSFQFVRELQASFVNIRAAVFCDEEFFITAAGPCYNVWNLSKGEILYSEESFESSIEEVLIKNAYLYATTEKSILYIWNWKLKLLVYKIETPHQSKITKIWAENEILMTASSEIISIWDLNTHTLVFKMDTLVKNEVLDLSPDRSLIGYSTGTSIILVANPYTSNDLEFLGGPEYEIPEFVKTLNSIYNMDAVEYKPEYTNWIIMPHRINLGHIYTFLGMAQNLSEFLNAGGAVINNSSKQNALSYSIDKNLDACTFTIISGLKKRLITNPFAFSFITHDIMISLNLIGSELLYKLYDLIYIESTQSGLPNFCPDNYSFPIYFHSNVFEITKEQFFENIEEQDEGVPIEYKQSLVKLSLETGSAKSREFIKSLINCPYPDIFMSSLVQDILNEKWLKLRWVHYIQGIVYAIHIIVFGFLIFQSDDPFFLFVALFVLNLILTIYELYQVSVVLLDYFTDPWNWIDFMRLASMNFFIVLYWIDSDPSPHNLLYFYTNSIVTILVFFRGISYFRLFQSTRYMIDLINQSIKDMLGFVFVLSFSVISFAFIFYTLENPDQKTSFTQSLVNSYSINLGGGEIFGGTIYTLVFYLSTIINPIILLNLLISILGSSFERVENSRVISNFKELANLVLEAEQLIYWRVENQETYFQSCNKPEEIEIPDPVLAKIKKVSMRVTSLDEKMDAMTERIFEKIEEKNELILNKISELKQTEVQKEN